MWNRWFRGRLAREAAVVEGGTLDLGLVRANPPAWNVEDTTTYLLVVDGAATKADALAIACRELSEVSDIAVI